MERTPTTSSVDSCIGPIVSRISEFPIDTIQPFLTEDYATETDRWIEEKDLLQADSQSICEAIYKLVPDVECKRLRSSLLDVKRQLTRELTPLSEETLCESGVLGINDILRTKLISIQNRREEFQVKTTRLRDEYEQRRISATRILHKTACDPKFLTSLCTSSPSIYHDTIKTSSRSFLNERLNRKLALYLLRAVGRPTPNGLWSAVSIATILDNHRAHLSVSKGQERVLAAPNLKPFFELFTYVSSTPPWAKLFHYKFQFGGSTLTKYPLYRELKRQSLKELNDHFECSNLEGVLEKFGNNQLVKYADLLEAFSAVSVKSEELVRVLISKNIFDPVPGIPKHYTDAWDALQVLVSHLPGSEKTTWQKCIVKMQRYCRDVSQYALQSDHHAVSSALKQIKLSVDELYAEYEKKMVWSNERLVFVDKKSSLEVGIRRDVFDDLERHIRMTWDFDKFGIGEMAAHAESEAMMSQFKSRSENIGKSDNSTLRSLKGERFPTPLRGNSWDSEVIAFSKRVGLSSDRLKKFFRGLNDTISQFRKLAEVSVPSNSGSYRHDLPPGSALVRIGVAGDSYSFRFGPFSHEPAAFYSRFSPVLSADTADDFIFWLRASLESLETENRDLKFLDLPVSASGNPNALCRPVYSQHSWADVSSSLQNGKLTIGIGLNNRPVISSGKTKIIVSPRSAVSPTALRAEERFFCDLNALLGRPSLAYPMPNLSSELYETGKLPRISLDAAVVSAARSSLTTSEVATLGNKNGWDRYVAWRRLVKKYRLPQYVCVGQPVRATEILLPTSSIIFVELVLSEVLRSPGFVQLQEAFPCNEHNAVKDSLGQRYISEFAVAWSGDQEFWRNFSNFETEQLST